MSPGFPVGSRPELRADGARVTRRASCTRRSSRTRTAKIAGRGDARDAARHDREGDAGQPADDARLDVAEHRPAGVDRHLDPTDAAAKPSGVTLAPMAER